jgi:cell division septum initiation protein DivIVA
MDNDIVKGDIEKLTQKFSELEQKMAELEHQLSFSNLMMMDKSAVIFKEINELHTRWKDIS